MTPRKKKAATANETEDYRKAYLQIPGRPSEVIILHWAARLNAKHLHRTTALTTRRNHQILLQFAVGHLIHCYPHLFGRKTDIKYPKRHAATLRFPHLLEAGRHTQRLQARSKVVDRFRCKVSIAERRQLRPIE